jgi:tetratricopeptide (TPR) repeat protein
MLSRSCIKTLGTLGIILSLFLFQLNAQTAEEYLKTAQKDFSEDRCSSALENIKRAIALNPGELEFRYLMALILIKQEKFETSAEILNALVTLNAFEFGKAYFDLAAIYCKQKKYKKAIAQLTKAEIVDRERALLQKGYIYLDTGKINKAIEEFLEVKDFPRFKQDACYNLGIAYQKKMDYKEALVYAQKAIEIAPEKGTAQNARDLIKAVKNEMKMNGRLRLFASSTNQYDDNVILRPLEQAGFQNIGITPSDRDDFATIITVTGEYKPVMNRNWELAFGSTYLQYLYAKLKTNDLKALLPSARLSFSVYPFYSRLFYRFGYFQVHNKSYAQVHSLSSVSSLVEGQYGRIELMLEGVARRYLDGITPDADHYMIGLRQFITIPNIGEAQLGYKYEIENNKEDKGDFIHHEYILGWTSPFILQTHLSVSYSYIIRDFELTDVIHPYQQRKDHEHLVFVLWSKRFGRHVELTFFYNHTLNDSNITNFIPNFGDFDPFHWKKNVVSLSLSLLF